MRIFSYLQRVVAVEQSKYLNIVVYDNDDIVVVSCIDIFCFRGCVAFELYFYHRSSKTLLES